MNQHIDANKHSQNDDPKEPIQDHVGLLSSQARMDIPALLLKLNLLVHPDPIVNPLPLGQLPMHGEYALSSLGLLDHALLLSGQLPGQDHLLDLMAFLLGY